MHKLEDVVGDLAYDLVEFVGKFWSTVAHWGWVWGLVDGLNVNE